MRRAFPILNMFLCVPNITDRTIKIFLSISTLAWYLFGIHDYYFSKYSANTIIQTGMFIKLMKIYMAEFLFELVHLFYNLKNSHWHDYSS